MLLAPKYHFAIARQSDLLADIDVWEPPQPGVFERGHVHSYYEVLVFKKGGGTHQMADDVFDVADGSIHVLAPNNFHELKRAPETDGFEIIFSETFLQQLQQFDTKTNYRHYFSQSHVLNLGEEQFREFEIYFSELIKNRDNKSLFNNWVSLILLKIITSDTEKLALPANTVFVKDVLALLARNYQQRPSLEFYASNLNMAVATFQRHMKAAFGKSIVELQNEQVIQELKFLLSQSDKPIKQISGEYNFGDESHLNHFFRKHVGMSPSAFRRQAVS
jgi:AraC-like DNA-binding protein